MSLQIRVSKDPFKYGYNLYKKTYIVLNPGVTVLVGCNGSGKSTLLHYLQAYCKKIKIPCISFDNLVDGGQNAVSAAGFYGNFSFVAESMTSSEGENLVMNLGTYANKIGQFVRNNQSANELWILLDACDSGLSIDNVLDVKHYLFETILQDNPDKKVHIIVSANSYAMAKNEQCFVVQTGEYRTFDNYDEYEEFVQWSRETVDAAKEKGLQKQAKKKQSKKKE